MNGTNKETENAKENKKKLFEKVVLESSSSASEDDLKTEKGSAEPSSSNLRTPSLQKRGRKDILHQTFLVHRTEARSVTDMQSSPQHL